MSRWLRKTILQAPLGLLLSLVASDLMPSMVYADGPCGPGHQESPSGCVPSEKNRTGDIPVEDAVLSVDAQGRIDSTTPVVAPPTAPAPTGAETPPAAAGPAGPPQPGAPNAPAPGGQQSEEQGPPDGETVVYRSRSSYLRPSELAKIFRGEVRIGTIPASSLSFREAYLEGQVFKDCAATGHFSFEEYSGSKEKGDEGLHGFMISDESGEGVACMQAHRRAGHVCTPDTCVPLRQLGASIDTSHMGAGEIRFCYPTESGAIQCDELGDRVEHRGRGWYAAQARVKIEANRASRKQRLMSTVSHCLGSAENRTLGRAAMETLTELGENMSAWKKRYDDKDFDDLRRLVNRGGDDADPDEIMDKLSAYAAEHPEKVEAIAKLYYDLALEQTKRRGATSKDFQTADRIISEAEKLDGLSKVSKERLKGYHTDILVGMLQAMSASGISNIAPTFWPMWQEAMRQLQSRVMETCYGGGGYGAGLGGFGGGQPALASFGGWPAGNGSLNGLGGLGDMSACTGAMSSMQAARSIPQVANENERQRFYFIQQMQSQLTWPMGTNVYGNTLSSPAMGLPGTTPFMGAAGTNAWSNPMGNPMTTGGAFFR